MNSGKNTDRELWRRNPDDYYSPSIHITSSGHIGINVGGHVIVQSIEQWHQCVSDNILTSPVLENKQLHTEGLRLKVERDTIRDELIQANACIRLDIKAMIKAKLVIDRLNADVAAASRSLHDVSDRNIALSLELTNSRAEAERYKQSATWKSESVEEIRNYMENLHNSHRIVNKALEHIRSTADIELQRTAKERSE